MRAANIERCHHACSARLLEAPCRSFRRLGGPRVDPARGPPFALPSPFVWSRTDAERDPVELAVSEASLYKISDQRPARHP
jgi:hypothetical protein